MSIIYDALKKLEQSSGVGLNSNTKKDALPRGTRVRIRIYLVYLLVGCAGLFLTNSIFDLLVKRESTTPSASLKVADVPALQEKLASLKKTDQTAPEPEVTPSFILNGVFYSGDEGYALINNQIVKVGDIIEGAIVKRVALEDVELEKDGKLIILSSEAK